MFANYLKKQNIFNLLIAVLIFILGWQLGHHDLQLEWNNFHPQISLTDARPPSASNVDFSLFWKVWNTLDQNYVDKQALDPQKMYYGAIQGMVSAVGDPYTMFLPPQAQKAVSDQLSGDFEGVGMELGYNKDNALVIIAPLPGTPADKAGVKPGDIILKIDNKDTSSITLPEAVADIRGPKGTQVSLELYRQGEQKPIDVSITRDTINVKSVAYTEKTSPDGKKVADIAITQFGEKTDDEWDQAVSQALANGDQAVVLDLRNNPGGYFEDAIYVASDFIKSGTIVMEEDGKGQKTVQTVDPRSKQELLNVPLVVLINKGSASAAEIVSGAIQDHKRGELVGEQSFGKGTVQQVLQLDNNTGLHVTTDKWLTPNGRWIHHIGLTPDVKVDAGNDPTKDPQLDKALQVLDQAG